MLKHKFKIICIFSFLTVLVSCGTQSVQQIPAMTPVLIETKAQIKSSGDSHNVKIDIALFPHKAIRLEVTGTLGYRVASVVMSPQKIQYALHTNQTYFEGPFSAKSMYPIFKQALDPRILWRAIHDESPQTDEIICQLDPNQKPLICKGPKNLMIKWTYEEAPRKRIEIKSNQFEMNWLFKDQKVLAESQTETFVLKKPEGYKEILLK